MPSMACGPKPRYHTEYFLSRAAFFTAVICAVVISSLWLGHFVTVPVIRKTKDLPQQTTRHAPSRCAPCPKRSAAPSETLVSSASDSALSPINCSVNGDYHIPCRRNGDQVFMPVSFINKFFEVYGELSSGREEMVYNFRSSYGVLHPVQQEYHPGGVFLHFDKYNVEVRDSILCLTAAEGVPLAIQWDKAGYFYAISIAQFGLSHHAKSLLEGAPVRRTLAGGNVDVNRWELMGKESAVQHVDDSVAGVQQRVMAFQAPNSPSDAGPTLPVYSRDRVLCFSAKILGSGAVTVKIRTRQNTVGYVSYALVDSVMAVSGNRVTYGLKLENSHQWVWLARDLFTDWLKGPGDIHNSSTWFSETIDVTLHGRGYIDNMTLSSSAHLENFMLAANWLLTNQDASGGWPTAVPVKTRAIQLPPNWYSAMAQGQAMSVLVRAYNLTQDRKYLEAAVRGMDLFTRDTKDGGVRTRFLGQFDWYEEYPTTPATFVLNGFIFSLLGLYDVMKTAQGDERKLAGRLWSSGVRSLKTLLCMFDRGDGTLYDLRHVISHEAPNRARWDYHITHIALVQEMAAIDGDPIFHRTAHRWTGYLSGKNSRQN